MISNATDSLRQRLDTGRTVVTATAYDMMAARLAADAGFDAVFCSGYGQAASHLGRPDSGFLNADVVVGRAQTMISSVDVPVLVDADEGFGDPAGTFARLAQAGAAAVMVEDQVPDKRCGHVAGKTVIDVDDMCGRIDDITRSRQAETLIIARTDAREPLGLEEALRRGRAYAEAGADVVFVEAPESREELSSIANRLPCPTMANVLPGGRTPLVNVDDLNRMGFALVVFGLVDLMVAGGALRAAFSALRNTGDFGSYKGPVLSFSELNEVTGLSKHVAGR